MRRSFPLVLLLAIAIGFFAARSLGPMFSLSPFGSVERAAGLARSISSKLSDMVNVRDLGAKCDGTTDDGPSFQTALSNYSVVKYTSDGCMGAYLINTTVRMPEGSALVGESIGAAYKSNLSNKGVIITTANIDTFVTVGSGVTFKGVYAAHTGMSGRIIDNSTGTYMTIEESALSGNSSAATDPLIYTAGSSLSVLGNKFYNNRASTSFSIDLDRLSANGVNIEAHISRHNEFSGAGSGVRIHNSDGSGRPEGVHITDNTFVNGGEYYVLTETVLFEDLIGNTFDLSKSGLALDFDPVASGNDAVIIQGNWLANEGRPRHGACLSLLNTHPGAGNVNFTIEGNNFRFCDTAVLLTNSANGIVIGHNNFGDISGIVLRALEASSILFVGNTTNNITGAYLYLRDGVSGGPYIVSDNRFSGLGVGTGFTSERSDNSKFMIAGNSGIQNDPAIATFGMIQGAGSSGEGAASLAAATQSVFQESFATCSGTQGVRIQGYNSNGVQPQTITNVGTSTCRVYAGYPYYRIAFNGTVSPPSLPILLQPNSSIALYCVSSLLCYARLVTSGEAASDDHALSTATASFTFDAKKRNVKCKAGVNACVGTLPPCTRNLHGRSYALKWDRFSPGQVSFAVSYGSGDLIDGAPFYNLKSAGSTAVATCNEINTWDIGYD